MKPIPKLIYLPGKRRWVLRPAKGLAEQPKFLSRQAVLHSQLAKLDCEIGATRATLHKL